MTLGTPGSNHPSPIKPIRLNIKPEPKFLDRRQQNATDTIPAHLSNPIPRAPSHELPPMKPVADQTANILATTHITLEDLAEIGVGDTLIYGSGTCREIVEIVESGAITVKTTKKWSSDELDHQFCSEPGADGFSAHDYLFLAADDELYPTFEVAEGTGTKFTIVEVQKTGNTVTGVVFSFSQVFPKGFAADVANIVRIQKKGQ